MLNARRKDHKGRVLQAGEYQRKNLTYEYRYTDVDGKRKSVYAPTLTELRTIEQEVSKRMAANMPNCNMTLNALFERWFASKIGIKPLTKERYIGLFNRYIRDSHIGEMQISKIFASTMKAYYSDIYKSRNVSIGYLKCLHNIILQAFNFAVDDALISVNPATRALTEVKNADRIAASESQTKREKALTKSEQDNFFSYLSRSKYVEFYVIFRILLLTGMRIGELVALQWDDINFKNRSIMVSHNLEYGKFEGDDAYSMRITSPKNLKRREIPLSDEAFDLLGAIMRLDAARGRYCRTLFCGLKNYVFVTERNRPYLPSVIGRRLEQIVNAYNREHRDKLPKMTCHWFRHTFATRLYEAGVAPKTIQKLMGHAKCDITMDVYTTAFDDVTRNGIDTFESYLTTIESGTDHNLTTKLTTIA